MIMFWRSSILRGSDVRRNRNDVRALGDGVEQLRRDIDHQIHIVAYLEPGDSGFAASSDSVRRW